ncbi:MAG: ABC transporter ATP-binding protein, partial [Candidatus Eisenbacteria bacterium]
MPSGSDRGATRAPRVELAGITRRFGATFANADVDLTLEPASIHALVGENGAGKSTLMRILYGLLRPERGRILIDGRPVEVASPSVALAHGIGMIHQHFMLVPRMTVLENVVLGFPGRRGLATLPRREIAAHLERLSAAYGLDLDPFACVENLGIGERQRVEIVRLLFHGARLLICDEPTAVLAPPEVDALFRTLERFRGEGRTVVFITHKLAEVLEVADRVTVLRRGRVVGGLERGQFDRDRLIQWIVGDEAEVSREITRQADAPQWNAGVSGPDSVAARRGPTRPAGDGPPALSVRGLGVVEEGRGPALLGVDFDLRAGEILGVAGVQGNGQRELAETVSGRRAASAGEIRIGARRIGAGESMPTSLRPAFIPEDRTSEGLIGGMPLWENLLLAHLGDAPFVRGGWFGHAAARAWARPLLTRFRVQPAVPGALPEALSGGNQQKLLCARELSRSVRILVAAQPTRGIDLASTSYLHDLLRRFRDEGGSVLLISADLEEILALADRI